MTQSQKNKLFDALNRIDEMAEYFEGETIKEKKQRAKDYDLLYKLIESQ